MSKDAPQTTEYCPFVLFLHFENSFLESQQKHVSLEDSGKFLLISYQFFHLNILSSVFQDGCFGTHIDFEKIIVLRISDLKMSDTNFYIFVLLSL